MKVPKLRAQYNVHKRYRVHLLFPLLLHTRKDLSQFLLIRETMTSYDLYRIHIDAMQVVTSECGENDKNLEFMKQRIDTIYFFTYKRSNLHEYDKEPRLKVSNDRLLSHLNSISPLEIRVH